MPPAGAKRQVLSYSIALLPRTTSFPAFAGLAVAPYPAHRDRLSGDLRASSLTPLLMLCWSLRDGQGIVKSSRMGERDLARAVREETRKGAERLPVGVIGAGMRVEWAELLRTF